MRTLGFSKRYKDPTQRREWVELVKIILPIIQFDPFTVRDEVSRIVKKKGIRPYYLRGNPNLNQFVGDILSETYRGRDGSIIGDGEVNGRTEVLRWRVPYPLFSNPRFIVEMYNVIYEIED